MIYNIEAATSLSNQLKSKAKNMQSPNFQSLHGDVEELFQRISRNIRKGGSKERLVDDVNECLEKLKRIGSQHRNECTLAWLADYGIRLASFEGLAPSLRQEVTEQIFAWLDSERRYEFVSLRDKGKVYFWCARENLGIRHSTFRDYGTSGDLKPKPIFSKDELDEFYFREHRLIWNVLANSIYPQGGVYLENPLAEPGALHYYTTYKKALDIPRIEEILPKDDARLS
jgi:hypothetical protein